MPGLRERRALLAIQSVPHVGPVTLHRVLAELGPRERLTRFFDFPPDELARRFKLRPAAIAAVCEGGERLLEQTAALECELRERDVHWLVAGAADYPGRLAQAPWSPPPVLFTRGNEDLLDLPAVALLNSADAPPRALEVTDALADRLAARGVAVVSGHNTAGYKAAAVAAVRHGAPRLLVLDRGLISDPGDAFDRELVAPARVWTPEWDALAGLVVSPFRPADGWARANSRRRDEMVASLATGLVAVHVRAGGVMEAIARAALRGGMWLGVWDGTDAGGNAALLAEGGRGPMALAPAAGLDALADRIAATVEQEAGRGKARGRMSRRWGERERHLLYGLLEAATGGPLDAQHLLDFSDLDRWPPDPAPTPAAATTAVRDATGVRDARPALQSGLDALKAGGWLAALVDAAVLAAEGTLRPWLAARAWVAATIELPARPEAKTTAAVLLRSGGGERRPVLAVTPEAAVTDAAGQHRYLTEARLRVRAHLNQPG